MASIQSGRGPVRIVPGEKLQRIETKAEGDRTGEKRSCVDKRHEVEVQLQRVAGEMQQRLERVTVVLPIFLITVL